MNKTPAFPTEAVEHIDDYGRSSPRQRLEWLTRAKAFVVQTMPKARLKKWLREREGGRTSAGAGE